MMKKMDKGFTLIELMIVVAIIGILAAVAIPGFIRYIKDSKTAEAKENLKSIGDGALAFYQTEHPTSATGATITKQFPSATVCVSTTDVGVMSCGTLIPKVPETAAEVGVKTIDTASWQSEPWKSLKFSIAKAFYYQYEYVGSGDTTGGYSSFEVIARAKLDKATTFDSCFKMDGVKDTTTGEASVGAMIDLSEGGTTSCPASAKAPAATQSEA